MWLMYGDPTWSDCLWSNCLFNTNKHLIFVTEIQTVPHTNAYADDSTDIESVDNWDYEAIGGMIPLVSLISL